MMQRITNEPHLGKVTFNVISDKIGGTRTTSKLYVYEEGGIVWFRHPLTESSSYQFLCAVREVVRFEAAK